MVHDVLPKNLSIKSLPSAILLLWIHIYYFQQTRKSVLPYTIFLTLSFNLSINEIIDLHFHFMFKLREKSAMN